MTKIKEEKIFKKGGISWADSRTAILKLLGYGINPKVDIKQIKIKVEITYEP